MKRRSFFASLTALVGSGLVLPAVAAQKSVIRAYPVESYELNEPALEHTHCVTDPGHSHGMLSEEHATPRPGWRFVSAETRPDGTVHFYPFLPLKE